MPMPLLFEVNDATLDYEIAAMPRMETVGLDRVSLLKEIIERTAQLKQHYETMISRYGKLIGQGRIGLLELLDELFIDIVLQTNDVFQSASRGSQAPGVFDLTYAGRCTIIELWLFHLSPPCRRRLASIP
jgi:hypothetical protein